MIKLAARSCNQVVKNQSLTRKNQSLTKAKIIPSTKSQAPKTISATAKKQAATQLRVPLSEKKVNGVFVPFAMRGRYLRRFTFAYQFVIA